MLVGPPDLGADPVELGERVRVGCPYGFGWPTLITTISARGGKNSGSDVSPPWCGIFKTSTSGTPRVEHDLLGLALRVTR